MRYRVAKSRAGAPWTPEIVPFPMRGFEWALAALATALMFVVAFFSDPAPNRAVVGVVSASLVALPFATMMAVQTREWGAAVRDRQSQLERLRAARVWRLLSPPELRDRLALLLHAMGHAIERIEPIGRNEEWALVGVSPRGEREVVEVKPAGEAATLQEVAAFVGRAVAHGAEAGVFVGLGGIGADVENFAAKLAVRGFPVTLYDADALALATVRYVEDSLTLFDAPETAIDPS